MNSLDAEFRMATLCVSYLSFDCFCPETFQQHLEKYSSNGSYAFQQYAACNWIQHVQSLGNCWDLLGNSERTQVYNACRVLLQRDSSNQSFEVLPTSELEKPSYAALHKALRSLYNAYEDVISISDNGIPMAMQQMYKVRMAVEHIFSTSTDPSTSRLLHESHGPLLFRCQIVQCPSFQKGFATQRARDNHYKAHEPPFRCPHEGCDYAILGFLAEITLKTHLRLCHDPISNQITFPKVRPRSAEDALNNAIDRNDLTAINHLATELSLIVDRNTGFLMRGIQKGSQQAAVLISAVLGREAEFVHSVKGRTAVSEAAKKGYKEVIKNFLNSCEDLSVREEHGQAAFLTAAFYGHDTVVRLLLDEGVAEVNDRRKGRTAILEAVNSGHEVMVRLLLERGADTAVKNSKGKTALHMAILSGHEAVAQVLLENGGYTEEKDKDGMTALFYAAEKGYEAVVRLILNRNADFKAENKDGWTALRRAAANGHEAVVRLLLDKGAMVDQNDDSGWTALHWAADNGHEAVVRLLLDKGAMVDEKDKYGCTALHWVAKNGHEAVVRLLLDKGAMVEKKDKYRWTALHWAAANGKEAVVRLLLDKGAIVEQKDKNGSTALHWAAEKGHKAVVLLLLDKGAIVEEKDKNGRTALHGAADNGFEVVVRLLQSKLKAANILAN